MGTVPAGKKIGFTGSERYKFAWLGWEPYFREEHQLTLPLCYYVFLLYRYRCSSILFLIFVFFLQLLCNQYRNNCLAIEFSYIFHRSLLHISGNKEEHSRPFDLSFFS